MKLGGVGANKRGICLPASISILGVVMVQGKVWQGTGSSGLGRLWRAGPDWSGREERGAGWLKGRESTVIPPHLFALLTMNRHRLSALHTEIHLLLPTAL